MRNIILVLSLIALSFASAQISTTSIVVNPQASFSVEVYVNKDYSGNSVPNYTIGEAITISVRPNQDAYIYLFDINSHGRITQLLPNRLPGGQNNYVRAGQTRTFPAGNEGFNFTVEGPAGSDQVIALASRTPLNTSQLVQFAQDPFARGQGSIEIFAETLSIIVQPIPVQSWVTDVAYINVVNVHQVQPLPPVQPVLPIQPIHPVLPPVPVIPPTPVIPLPPVPLIPTPIPSGLLSSCANLYAPFAVSVMHLNDDPYSSDAILYTREDLQDVYSELSYQLEQQGYYEYDYYVDFNSRMVEATAVRGEALIDIMLERIGGTEEVHFTLFCHY